MKYFKLSLFCIILLSLTSCNKMDVSRYKAFSQNLNKNMYTLEIQERLSKKESFTIEVFDNNYYKTFKIDSRDFEIINNFFSSLEKENFLSNFPEDIKKNKFEIILNFTKDNKKYIINIFDDSVASIAPWDGSTFEDVLSLDGIPLHYNLYNFCSYIEEMGKKS